MSRIFEIVDGLELFRNDDSNLQIVLVY